ncbi:PQQ-dependent sugar dehydrogenase [Ferruginivarius sediminum]|uniref:Glucose/Sorbosone dehydrogenase domain-containing protein n=1 Tax=Ferruginivarius sediminum TaxID=2661937 RepID=A0A369TJ27_9PROT|nr:PQQ-dependent sugar dehydrogenase [Ferruginivarius sediminum]RDD62896.1 hypothetical protein DRB17_05850 [Ferruginivarius sediminum]
MRLGRPIAAFAVATLLALPVAAQQVPQTVDEVAQPGGTLPGNPKVALVKVADGFADPVNVANAGDGSGRLFVVERVGRIKIVNEDGSVNEDPFLDLTKLNPLGSIVQTGFVEQGLYAVAFHPNFEENGHFFVHYASLPFNGDGMIVRFTVDPDSPDVVSAERANETSKVIMRIEQPWYNHNGGQIEFGPDGYLYIGSGDGGWEGDPLQAGKDLSTKLAKMLRIDVDTENGAYAIPESNPFAHASDERLMNLFGITEEQFAEIRTKADPAIWAYGVRNPYEFAFDPETGDLFIADVGQNHWEEIIWQPADSKGGEYYGWPDMGAGQCHPLTGPDTECPTVGVLPVAQYPHQTPYPGADQLDENWGCSAQGLGVARYGGMDGAYLVGDWCSGRLWGLGWDGDNETWQFQELLQTGLQFTAGGLDEDGYVMAVTANNFYLADQGPEANPPGTLWRVMPRDEVPEGAEVARTKQ